MVAKKIIKSQIATETKPRPPKVIKSETANKVILGTAAAGTAVVGGYLAWFEAKVLLHNPELAAGLGAAIASGVGGALLYKILNHTAGEKFAGVDLDEAAKFLKKPAVLAALGAATTLAVIELPYISALVGVSGLVGYVAAYVKDEKNAQPVKA